MSECKHKWIFQETKSNTSRIRGDYYDGYSVTFNRLDRYYCENCCEIKELKKSEDEAMQHSKEVAKKESDKLLKVGDEYICSECGKEHDQLAGWLEELKKYKDLEEKGLLLKLPCKVGDTVYEVDEGILFDDVIEPIKCKVTYILIKSVIHIDVEVIEGHGVGSTYTFELDDFGKTVFLTREDAEKELERRLSNESGIK